MLAALRKVGTEQATFAESVADAAADDAHIAAAQHELRRGRNKRGTGKKTMAKRRKKEIPDSISENEKEESEEEESWSTRALQKMMYELVQTCAAMLPTPKLTPTPTRSHYSRTHMGRRCVSTWRASF